MNVVNDGCKSIDKASPLSVVNSLLCPVCHSNRDTCEYYPVHCEGDETMCLTEKIWTITEKEIEFEFIRRCGKPAECSRVGTYSSNIRKFAVSTTCCNSSLCLSPVPTFPSQTANKNGLTCPSCYIENSNRCFGKDPLECVGNESNCINYVKQEIYENTVTFQSLYGCATDSICSVGSSTKKFLYLVNDSFKTVTMDMTCSSSMGLIAPFHFYLVFILLGLRTIKFIV
ncbi:hypothetical protein XELAEV_18036249mg [Xenopus laevis]|uniref:UPAR/Ly6 domain-containing protein n=1 Tax=Xenopus laevis TaxID=8355 RepID=A0A974CH93_XENLA|nr:hypothetical protein XELAEV_18036249mg [Xenopus laevis]